MTDTAATTGTTGAGAETGQEGGIARSLTEQLLTVEGLDVTFATAAGPVRAVRDVSLTLHEGECLAIVGESGSGKSVTARTLVGLTGGRSTVQARRISFGEQDLTTLSESGWRAVRGQRIGLVFQDALVSLDPLRTVGAEVAEPLRTHRLISRPELADAVQSLLSDVGIPDPAQRARQYPHQLSGGLRQRALIASALAAQPSLLIADEPTTALDVTVQAQILGLLGTLKQDGTALLLISHDLSVVARLADRIAVMYGGLIVEQGPAERVMTNPQHPYTQALIAAVPSNHAKNTTLSIVTPDRPAATPEGCPYAHRCARADQRCRDELPSAPATHADPGRHALCWHPGPPAFEPTGTQPPPPSAQPRSTTAPITSSASDLPLIEVESISKRFRAPDGTWYHAVQEVSFQLNAGETLGLVGESGSGKTTAARIVLGLVEPDAGAVRFAGEAWSALRERDRRTRRRRIQAVYQDPLSSFDPRHTVGRILGEAVVLAGTRRAAARQARVSELLDQVGLSPNLVTRRPRELSGGQRQRVAIARALASSPELIVCDEPVSALDVSVQAQILDLLAALQRELGVAMLFISHDLGVIRHVSDRIAVMKDGHIVEAGDTGQVFASPRTRYARDLLDAIPRLDAIGSGEH